MNKIMASIYLGHILHICLWNVPPEYVSIGLFTESASPATTPENVTGTSQILQALGNRQNGHPCDTRSFM